MAQLTEAQRHLMRHMLERELQNAVEGLLDVYHWRWTHFRPGRTSTSWRTSLSGAPGFPDIVAVRAGRLIFAELKRESEKLSDGQEAWLRELQGCAQGLIGEAPEFYSYIWKPSHLLSGEIARILE